MYTYFYIYIYFLTEQRHQQVNGKKETFHKFSSDKLLNKQKLAATITFKNKTKNQNPDSLQYCLTCPVFNKTIMTRAKKQEYVTHI